MVEDMNQNQGMNQNISQSANQNNIEQQIANAQDSGTEQNSGDNKGNEYSQIAGIISDLDRRLRVLEERYSNLRKKIQLTDQNIIESDRSFGKELRTFNDEILSLKRNVSDFDEKIVAFDSEMDNVAQKTDLKIVEKYLAMWSPQTFVTRKELKEYLKSKNIKLIEDSEE
jgi:predicted  nucleic acid-binding Zn-ribbon protein